VASFEGASFRLAASSATRRPGAVGARVAMLDLLDQLAFYGSYHRDPVNKAIHAVCVPGIAWSVMVWLASYGALVDGAHLARGLAAVPLVPNAVASCAVPSPALAVMALYALYYVALDAIAGTAWFVCVGVPTWLSATAFGATVGEPAASRWALGAHVACWALQIYPGHVAFERRRPAVLDSLFQSLVLAPLFVWMEIMFACGYRPGLQADLKRRVAKRVEAMDAESSRRSNAASHHRAKGE
jgi:uncharacterized membrane protein YGL010W